MSESPTKEVAVHKQTHMPMAYIPTKDDWQFMRTWGHEALKSGMLPTSIKNPEAAALIILKGRELGISFMQAIAHIVVINGKPSMSAELLQAMARKNLPGLTINIVESTDTMAKAEFKRPEPGSKPYTQVFSWDDAIRAGVATKTVWTQYPAAMLWSRAVTAGLRKVCPEALMGVSYTPEELGAHVNESGEVIETTGRHVAEPPKAEEPKQPEEPKEDKEKRKTLFSQIMKDASVLNLDEEHLIDLSMELFNKSDSKLLTIQELETFCGKLGAMIMGTEEGRPVK